MRVKPTKRQWEAAERRFHALIREVSVMLGAGWLTIRERKSVGFTRNKDLRYAYECEVLARLTHEGIHGFTIVIDAPAYIRTRVSVMRLPLTERYRLRRWVNYIGLSNRRHNELTMTKTQSSWVT